MQFTQTPQPYAPLGAEVTYAIRNDVAGSIDLRITDTANNTLLGAKRFAAVSAASFDAAPYLRRAVRFFPTTGRTGFYPATNRVVTAVVEAEAVGSGRPVAAPTRSFLPCIATASAPALLTALPLHRLISAGECDELTLLIASRTVVTVTAQSRGVLSAESYAIAEAGLHLFRLNTCDYPDVEYLTVDAGACGTVEYTLVPLPQGACQLAWRSKAGSIEHYTFPVAVSTTVEAAKKRAYGPDGHTAIMIREEERTVLRSAYETQQMLGVLSELLSSPNVWLVENDGYMPIDVVTEKAAIQQQGTMSCLEIEVRLKHKTQTPWS